LRVEYTVSTRADRELAWKVFSDFRHWHSFSDIYGDISWLENKPWTPGSHLRIELLRPERTVLDHVITVCSPPNLVAWIDHAHSNTMEQWVNFKPLLNGGTEIHTWADLMGPTSTIGGRDVRDVVSDFIRNWYDRFSEKCNQLADQR
jgi:hypothetical protein